MNHSHCSTVEVVTIDWLARIEHMMSACERTAQRSSELAKGEVVDFRRASRVKICSVEVPSDLIETELIDL